MILGAQTQIRTAEPDDGDALYAFYPPFQLHAATLDARREPIFATANELRESLANPEMAKAPLFVVESLTGEILGFCGLRGMNYESGFGELYCLFPEGNAYPVTAAEEALAFLSERAAQSMSLRKVLAHCLPHETGYRKALLAQGFTSDGVMRQVLYSEGRWMDLEALSRFLVTPAPETQEGDR